MVGFLCLSYKRVNRNYLFFVSIPFIFVFGGWYGYEIIERSGATTPKQMIGILLPMIVGGFVGAAIGLYKFYLPSIRQANEMLDRIEEMKEADVQPQKSRAF